MILDNFMKMSKADFEFGVFLRLDAVFLEEGKAHTLYQAFGLEIISLISLSIDPLLHNTVFWSQIIIHTFELGEAVTVY